MIKSSIQSDSEGFLIIRRQTESAKNLSIDPIKSMKHESRIGSMRLIVTNPTTPNISEIPDLLTLGSRSGFTERSIYTLDVGSKFWGVKAWNIINGKIRWENAKHFKEVKSKSNNYRFRHLVGGCAAVKIEISNPMTDTRLVIDTINTCDRAPGMRDGAGKGSNMYYVFNSPEEFGELFVRLDYLCGIKLDMYKRYMKQRNCTDFKAKVKIMTVYDDKSVDTFFGPSAIVKFCKAFGYEKGVYEKLSGRREWLL